MLKRRQYVCFLCLLMSLTGCSATKTVVNDDGQQLTSGAANDGNVEQYEVIACKDIHKTSEASGCTRTGEGDRIVLKGDILSANKVYQNGIVIVDRNVGKILYTGCDQENLHQPEEILITCADSVISPGMINAHDHITYSNARPAVWGEERYEHRHDWRKGIHEHTPISGPSTTHNEIVELRQMMGGATSVFGSGKVRGLVRNLDEEVVGGVKSIYQTFPLGDGQNTEYTNDSCSYQYHESVTHFDETCPYGPHLGEGINEAAHNEMVCLSGENGGVDIFKPNLAVIHGVAVTPDIVEKMALNHVKMVWSPRTNISLYGDTAPVTVYDEFGVIIGLGTDWIYSGSANMLRELQCVDYLNQNYYNHHFTDYEIWRMPTMGSALAMGVSHELGQINQGYLADIVIYHKQQGVSPYRSVIQAQNKDIQLVMIGGKLVYGDDNLILEGEKLDVCGVMKKYDAVAADAKTLESVSKYAAYPMFFCDTPEDEPSCVPQRTREEDTVRYNTSRYSAISEGDRDGDGVTDAQDNCPDVFNPVRPQNISRIQGDFDGDGIGDICDRYPLCRENDSTCKIYTKDHDGDGIEDYFDNCPELSNSDQSDIDGDNLGDVCDKCDDRYDRDGDGLADNCDKCPDDGLNEDGNGCSLKLISIGSIRQSVIEDKFETGNVKIKGTITAVGKRGFFIQDGDSGMYIFETPSDINVLNDTDGKGISLYREATVIGTAVTYYGFTELKEIQSVVLENGPVRTLEAKVVKGDEISRDCTDKTSKNKSESTLVKVRNLKVKSLFKSKKNNYAVAIDDAGNEVYIDDFLIGDEQLLNLLSEGKVYDITGIIVYDYSMSKLAPRSPEDIVGK